MKRETPISPLQVSTERRPTSNVKLARVCRVLLSAAIRMQFSVRLSLCLLGFILVSLFPQPAQGQVSSPRRFRAKILSPTKLNVSWKEPKGEFESYKVIYSTQPGGEQTEVQVSKKETKLLIEDFDPSKEYNFKIIAVSGKQQSKPLQAKHEAQRSGVEIVQSQRTQDSGVTQENNEISEGPATIPDPAQRRDDWSSRRKGAKRERERKPKLPSFFSHPGLLLCAVQLAVTFDPLTLTPDPWTRSHATPFCVHLAMATPWSLLLPRSIVSSHPLMRREGGGSRVVKTQSRAAGDLFADSETNDKVNSIAEELNKFIVPKEIFSIEAQSLRYTMFPNASVPLVTTKTSRNGEATSVDIDAIMDNVSIVLYTLTVVLGITGNSVVIWVAGFKLKPKVTNVWLVNLAIADLIFCFTRVLSLTKKLFFDHWPFGIFLCKFNGFFKYANMFCSVFLLAIISLDRALCVWHPVFTKRRRTLFAARVVAVCVWITAIIFSTPYFIYRHIHLKNTGPSALWTRVWVSTPSSSCAASCCLSCHPHLLHRGWDWHPTHTPVREVPPTTYISIASRGLFLCWAPYHCLLLVKMLREPAAVLCMGLDVRGRFRQSLAGVYKRALAEDIDGQTTQSNERSLDDSSGSKQSTVVVSGRSRTTVDVAKV
ncbi:fMet-Leu-Phe receptor [Collichthys lucidus]|uniref:fMet-Leu-Phe receptor n=1 Tax=Collichthys lucidus TaxID=240159 RepID=A0A4U5VMT7_COLLU|nr:fMet-Leu-Phe receptor [Collichthys lucidus]